MCVWGEGLCVCVEGGGCVFIFTGSLLWSILTDIESYPVSTGHVTMTTGQTPTPTAHSDSANHHLQRNPKQLRSCT